MSKKKELPCSVNEKVWVSHKGKTICRAKYLKESAIIEDVEKGYIIAKTKEELLEKMRGKNK